MAQLNAQTLKERFPELSSTSNYVLAPLVDVLAEKLLQELRENPNKHGFSDFHEEFTKMFDPPKFKAVFDGKIVEIDISHVDIDHNDEDESWYAIGGLHFYTDGRTGIDEKISAQLKRFLDEHGNLAELKSAAAAELRKGKTYHLRSDLYDFYLR